MAFHWPINPMEQDQQPLCKGVGKPVYLDYGGPGVVVPRCPECRLVVVLEQSYATPAHREGRTRGEAE